MEGFLFYDLIRWKKGVTYHAEQSYVVPAHDVPLDLNADGIFDVAITKYCLRQPAGISLPNISMFLLPAQHICRMIRVEVIYRGFSEQGMGGKNIIILFQNHTEQRIPD